MRNDLVYLLLRVSVGSMMFFGHGLPKLMAFNEKAQTFADPLGVGHMASLVLAIFAEVFCAAAVALGLLTRLSAIPLVINMAVAVLIVHAQDPWSKKELALLYLIPFLCIAVTGGGRWSLD